MEEYRIEVKPWMLKKSSEAFDFMAKWNNDVPMPLLVMYGTKIGESPKMTKFRLHGDIQQRITTTCMCCGRPITNKISQYFGVGPVCGGHNYTSPFATEEELNEAVAGYRAKLVNTVWTGWISNSAIISIDGDTDISQKLSDMPFEVTEDSEYCFADAMEHSAAPTYNSNVFVVNARIAKPVKGTDDYSVFISFKYNAAIKDAIKSLGTHIWNGDTKEWEIDYKDFKQLKHTLTDMDCTLKISSEVVIPDKAEIPADFTFKTKPMQHQIDGVRYGLNHNRFLLGDSMGCGKSKQLIDLAVIRKQTQHIKHCLIICGVNSLKWNWLEEIEKHSDETGWILGMYQAKRTNKWVIGSNADKLADLNRLGNDTELDSHFFIITNIESIRDAAIAAKLKELCDNDTISMIAIDEIHRVRNLKTISGTNLLQLQPTYRVGMTGTPLINTPLDLYAILKWLGYQRYGFYSFKDHFCEVDDWGNPVRYKNIDQLQGQLDSIMLRRTKDQVLDLPDKVYISEYVELTSEQKKLYNQAISDSVKDDSSDCVLATILKLRQVSGGIGEYSNIKINPKLDRLEQIVEEAVYSGTKVIVYSNWVGGITPAIERLQKYNPVVITGEVKDSDRQAIVNRFQTDDSVKVICCTVGAAGTGLTLTAATEVVFLDEPFTDATKEQACDRAHRIGTTSRVTIHTIMSHGTYDELVHDIVLGKKDLSDAVVDKNELAKFRIL